MYGKKRRRCSFLRKTSSAIPSAIPSAVLTAATVTSSAIPSAMPSAVVTAAAATTTFDAQPLSRRL